MRADLLSQLDGCRDISCLIQNRRRTNFANQMGQLLAIACIVIHQYLMFEMTAIDKACIRHIIDSFDKQAPASNAENNAGFSICEHFTPSMTSN
jgi:hypothetical protein